MLDPIVILQKLLGAMLGLFLALLLSSCSFSSQPLCLCLGKAATGGSSAWFDFRLRIHIECIPGLEQWSDGFHVDVVGEIVLDCVFVFDLGRRVSAEKFEWWTLSIIPRLKL
ncbi:hypothetical protein HG531_007360 [Fusarium graminearum]|nr:hypothetical protein HG531_007360 [Fusarium graminearum]